MLVGILTFERDTSLKRFKHGVLTHFFTGEGKNC